MKQSLQVGDWVVDPDRRVPETNPGTVVAVSQRHGIATVFWHGTHTHRTVTLWGQTMDGRALRRIEVDILVKPNQQPEYTPS